MGFVKTADISSELQGLLTQLAIDQALAARLARWSVLSQASLVNLAHSLALGTNKFRELAEWTDEIAQRDGTQPSDVLSTPDLLDMMGDLKQSVPLKQKAVRTYLFQQRFPQLAKIRGSIDAVIAMAKLPNDVSVQVPENLERNEIKVQFTARSVAEFQERIAKLQQLDVQGVFTCLSNPS